MAVTDARVKFLRGLQANLPATKTDGNVYIATDERAMYVDYNDGTTIQRIRMGDFREYNTFAEIQALSTTNLSTTALYYAKDKNILCKYTGTGWKQINAQKELTDYISSITNVVSLSGNVATVQMNVVSNGVTITDLSPNHKFETLDADAIKLTIDASTKTIKLRGRNVTASTEATVAADGTVTLQNVYSGTDSAGTAVSSTVASTAIKFTGKQDGGVKVTGNATTGVITFDADYRIAGVAANTSKSLDIGLTDINSSGIIVEESKMRLTPKILVGDSSISQTPVDATVVYTANTKEAEITLALPVYTITQVDNLISTELKNINAMTFKGNIKATGGTVTTPPLTDNTVKIGDTYIVADTSATYQIEKSGTTQRAIKGDLFIATSTNTTTPENTLGYIDDDDIKWVHVPSGDDLAHTYALEKATAPASAGSFDYVYLKNESNVQQGYGVGIGTGLASENVTVNGETVVVLKHKAYAAPTTTTATAVSLSQNTANSVKSGSITAITALTLENGHITGYQTQSFSVSLTEAIIASRFTNSITSNVVTLKAEVENSAGVWLDATGMTLSSNSLTFSRTSAAAMNVDLLWETF